MNEAPPSSHPEIESLVDSVASRHNRFLARNILVTALGCVGAALIAAALFWVLRGYSVPWTVPVLALSAGALCGAVFWAARRMTRAQAAGETDRFFELKDGIATARHLGTKQPQGDVTGLQWNWLKPRLAECDPARITSPFPRRGLLISGLLATAAAVLCLLPPSSRIRAAELQAEQTREQVADTKEELAKLIEELKKEASEDEEDAAKLDEFRKLVDSVEETGDRTEAARQFARIEQKLRDASKALDQRRDEETLAAAAKELAKAQETEARQLGKKIEAKELAEAAEMLRKMAAKAAAEKIKNAGDKQEKAKALDEAKKELARMRSISKRLSAAGKQRQGARSAQNASNENSNMNHKQSDSMSDENAASSADSQSMEDMLAELDESAESLEGELEEMELDPNAEKVPAEMLEKAEKFQGKLDKLGQRMKGMQARSMAKGKLDQLRAALSRASSGAQSPSAGQMLALAQAPGGQAPGVGTDENRRTETDDSQKNGELASLKGQHGQGPSLSAVEEASEGSGVSSRGGSVKERNYSRQAESFVQRDDIPEALKTGVRDYFKNLQPTAPQE